jgi:hypothetical protein
MELISEGYLEQQKILHKNQNYGVASKQVAHLVDDLIVKFNVKSLCDYGAGKQLLRKSITQTVENYYPYDPAFAEYGEAREADLVCCIDVLEHIEPDLLDNVLNDLQRITTNKAFFTIHTGPAAKVLPDGRNAHLIQKPILWWQMKIKEKFIIDNFHQSGVTVFLYLSAMNNR